MKYSWVKRLRWVPALLIFPLFLAPAVAATAWQVAPYGAATSRATWPDGNPAAPVGAACEPEAIARTSRSEFHWLQGKLPPNGVAAPCKAVTTPDPVPVPEPTPTPTPAPAGALTFLSFDGPNVPLNKEGHQYPKWSDGKGGEGGMFTSSIEDGALKMRVVAQAGTGNRLYAAFNPYDGVRRHFARTCCDPVPDWKFNTYNRWSFSIKAPAHSVPVITDGRWTANIGAYAKRIANPDYYSDEAGGGHLYYDLNIPRTGTWARCTLNFFVDHWRGNSGGTEEGSAERITNEPGYNLFDALTRFYIQMKAPPVSLPADYYLDDMTFWNEPRPEAEQQVRDTCVAYVKASNRLILTWMRHKDENSVKHEVRYAFSDIHVLGWDKATPAPLGIITPPGYQGYHGMVYDTTALNLNAVTGAVYLAIKPQNSTKFTQVSLPLP